MNRTNLKQIVKQVLPPFVLQGIRKVTGVISAAKIVTGQDSASVSEQDLAIYWNDEMAQLLETWGEANVWKELPLLMVNCRGKVLDIACGTGKSMEIIAGFPLDLHGCDISDLLIGKAIGRGIRQDHLTVCDATSMPYENNSFDYAYSIGSLEHFTEEGIRKVMAECHRVVRNTVFHMVPVSRSGQDEGWLKTNQSFHNNSVAWWLEKYQAVYKTVHVLDSTWDDHISVGKWFVCMKNEVV